MAAVHKLRKRGERTRAHILAAATELFAEKGFAETRLEDVAQRVGVKRAALVYYFRDKQHVYDAVLNEAGGDFIERITAIVTARKSPDDRIESMVHAWVDLMAERPWFARIMLREVADATPANPPSFAPYVRTLLQLTETVLEEGRLSDVFHPVDALHLASAVAGTTVFFVSVMPAVAPAGSFDPLEPQQLAAHRKEVLAITRRLLGIGRPRVVGGKQRKGAR